MSHIQDEIDLLLPDNNVGGVTVSDVRASFFHVTEDLHIKDGLLGGLRSDTDGTILAVQANDADILSLNNDLLTKANLVDLGLKVDKENNLADFADLNSIITSGFYRVGINPVNAPINSDKAQLIISRGGDTITQIISQYSTNDFWVRAGNPVEVGGSGSWSTWKELGTGAGGGGLSPWQVNTSDVTAANTDRFLSDTSLNPITITLPLAPGIGEEIEIKDSTSSFALNGLFVSRNGEPIQGLAEDLILDVPNAYIRLVYVGGSVGWNILSVYS